MNNRGAGFVPGAARVQCDNSRLQDKGDCSVETYPSW